MQNEFGDAIFKSWKCPSTYQGNITKASAAVTAMANNLASKGKKTTQAKIEPIINSWDRPNITKNGSIKHRTLVVEPITREIVGSKRINSIAPAIIM